MRTLELQRDEWGPYLERKGPAVRWSRASIEVLDESRKRLTEAWKEHVETIFVDPDGCLRLQGPELCHTVRDMKSLTVVVDGLDRLAALEAVDGDGIRHVVRLTPPRALAGSS